MRRRSCSSPRRKDSFHCGCGAWIRRRRGHWQEPTALPWPFWSPDSQSVGFFADGKLKRVDIDSGSVQPLAEAPFGQGGTWSRDGVILFSPFPPGPVFRVSAAGGDVTPQTEVVTPQQGHNSPHFLPDGRHFLYFVRGGPEVRGIYVGQIDDPSTRRLRDADSGAVYARPGHLLFVRDGTIFAQPFDLDRLQFTGDPFLLAEQAASGSPGPPAASAVGPIAYRTGAGHIRCVSSSGLTDPGPNCRRWGSRGPTCRHPPCRTTVNAWRSSESSAEMWTSGHSTSNVVGSTVSRPIRRTMSGQSGPPMTRAFFLVRTGTASAICT